MRSPGHVRVLALVCCLAASIVMGAPPHPPSSPDITAAIYPHPPEPFSYSNDNKNNPYHQQYQQHQREHRMKQTHDDFLSEYDDPEYQQSTADNDIIQSNYDKKSDAGEDPKKKTDGQREEETVLITGESPSNSNHNNDELGPALNVLSRRKRTPKPSPAARPYSSVRGRPPSSSRYRYPINNKRASRVPPHHDYSQADDDDDENVFFNLYEDYPEEHVTRPDQSRFVSRRPSLFRERSSIQPKGKFLEETIPSELLQELPQIEDKREFSDLPESPLDLETMARIYDLEKHGGGEENRRSGEFYQDTVKSLQRRRLDEVAREKLLELEEAQLIKDLLSGSPEAYYMENSPVGYSYRQKRNASPIALETSNTRPNNITNSSVANIKMPTQVAVAEYRAKLTTDRKKRAFGTSVLHNRRKKSYGLEAIKRQSQEELDDFLTREYFKTIARSVGNKKKRMPYAKFEADKRSGGIEAFLDNPEMLQYMIDKVKESEDSVAEEAQDDIRSGAKPGSTFMLHNALTRMGALERMEGALEQLKMLHDSENRKRSLGRSNRRRKKSFGEDEDDLAGMLAVSQHTPIPAVCSGMQKVHSTCQGLVAMTGDVDGFLLSSCVRHQLCRMCGAVEGVDDRECDVVLSSALQDNCDGSVSCLRVSEQAYRWFTDNTWRSNPPRSCIDDPCIRSLVESRR